MVSTHPSDHVFLFLQLLCRLNSELLGAESEQIVIVREDLVRGSSNETIVASF